MPMHETQNTLLNNLGCKYSLVMKFGHFMQYYKTNFFIKKLYEKCGLETSSRPFLIFQESSVKRILKRAACRFGQILIALLLHISYKSLLQKFHFPIEVVLNSLQIQKGLELVFRPQFL